MARQWLAAGCRTLDDIRAGKHGVRLSAAQKTGLKYYDGEACHCAGFSGECRLKLFADINARMPREEAQAIFDLIKPVGRSCDLYQLPNSSQPFGQHWAWTPGSSWISWAVSAGTILLSPIFSR